MAGIQGLIDALKRSVSYPEEVQSVLARDLERLVLPGCRVLDVGCGTTSELASFNRRESRRFCHLIGLDAHAPTIDWCRNHGFHDEYVLADVRDHDRIPQVDVIVATDLVEHLEKAVALQVIAQFERKATTAVILFTPNGYIFNPFTPDNPYMEHKCGFTTDELTSLGYRCVGLGGPRGLRDAGSRSRGPKVIALPVLAVLSRTMRRLPRQSFHLLAQKTCAPASRRPPPAS